MNRPVIIVNLIPSFGIYVVYNILYKNRLGKTNAISYNIILKKHNIIHMYPFVLHELTKYPTIGENIVSINGAVPMMTPVTNGEVPLSGACTHGHIRV